MSAPRRYRLALLAFPGRYRAVRGRELLATLADGDDERGRPSMREAAALAYRGVATRAQIALSGEGLLVAAAALILLSLVGGFSWIERYVTFDGHPGVLGGLFADGPGTWRGLALGVCAYLLVAVALFGAADNRPRRQRATLLAIPLALAVFGTPGDIVNVAVSHTGQLPDFTWMEISSLYANWRVTVPMCAAAAAGTWIALAQLGRLDRRARVNALGLVLVLLSAAVLALTWHRPGIGDEYTRSAFEDLQTGTFIAGLGLLVAVLGLLRARRADPAAAGGRRGSNPH